VTPLPWPVVGVVVPPVLLPLSVPLPPPPPPSPPPPPPRPPPQVLKGVGGRGPPREQGRTGVDTAGQGWVKVVAAVHLRPE
jgi:hypothetical protein